MRNPVTQRFSAVLSVPGPQGAVNLDFLPFGTTTVAVIVVSGVAEFSVEFTLDDVNDATVTPRWLTLEDIPAGTSETIYSAFYWPVQFIRLNIEALTGDLEFKVAQSGTPRS